MNLFWQAFEKRADALESRRAWLRSHEQRVLQKIALKMPFPIRPPRAPAAATAAKVPVGLSLSSMKPNLIIPKIKPTTTAKTLLPTPEKR